MQNFAHGNCFDGSVKSYSYFFMIND